PRSSSATGTRCCAAARGQPISPPSAARSATGAIRSAGRSLLASAAPGTPPMCRHVAYVGPPVSLAELLLDPPFGLLRQSWEPRHQQHGRLSAEGLGVGWSAGDAPVPARYRRDRPMWTDANLPELARVIRSGAVLAAVRSGTDGMGHAEGAAAPFRDG